MPLYDFKCKFCDYKFEKFASLKTLKAKCPHCKGVAVRLISLPGAIICDGHFSLAGKVDRRLGDTPITGRKDYRARVKEKGFRELSSRETKDLVEDAEDRGKEPVRRALPTVNI